MENAVRLIAGRRFFSMEENVEHKMDLHTYSLYSDGDRAPGELAHLVKEAGVDLWALSDHDCTSGVDEAILAGKALGITVVPAVEFDNEFAQELHILGLCVDHHAPSLVSALEDITARRAERNHRIVERLRLAGYDVAPFLESGKMGVITRLHIATALQVGGLVQDLKQGFTLLKPGGVGYVHVERFSPGQVISLIKRAGGIPVVAHPCHLRGNVRSILTELISLGVEGLEAYYSTATKGQTAEFVSLAAQNGLLVTCGSDFHSFGRSQDRIGCAWQNVRELERTRKVLEARLRMGR